MKICSFFVGIIHLPIKRSGKFPLTYWSLFCIAKTLNLHKHQIDASAAAATVYKLHFVVTRYLQAKKYSLCSIEHMKKALQMSWAWPLIILHEISIKAKVAVHRVWLRFAKILGSIFRDRCKWKIKLLNDWLALHILGRRTNNWSIWWTPNN